MTKNKYIENDCNIAIAAMSGEDNWVSGYCRLCCYIYIFQAKINNTSSSLGINGGRVSKLSVWCVEEAGERIRNREAAHYYERDWKVKSEIGNDPVACSAIISWLEQLPPVSSDKAS